MQGQHEAILGNLKAAAALPTHDLPVDQDEFQALRFSWRAIERAACLAQTAGARIQRYRARVARIHEECKGIGVALAQRDIAGQEQLDIAKAEGLDTPAFAIVEQRAAPIQRRSQYRIGRRIKPTASP